MNAEPLLLDRTPIHITLISLDLDDFQRKGLDTIVSTIKTIEDEFTLINVALQLQDPYTNQRNKGTVLHIHNKLAGRLAAFCPCWLIAEILTHRTATTSYEYKTEARVSTTQIKYWYIIKLVPVGLIDLVKG